MDWKDLAGSLVKAGAPIIGGAIGGPFGALIGGGLGSVLASALGVDETPEAVNNAITTGDPAVIANKLSAAESEAVAKWPALAQIAQAEGADRTAQAQAINATMQAEVARGQPWWAWRNLWGYSVAAECAGVGIVILKDLFTGNGSGVALFLSASNFFLTWYGMRIGVLGYIFRGINNEKIAAVTGEAPSVVKSIIKAVTRK